VIFFISVSFSYGLFEQTAALWLRCR